MLQKQPLLRWRLQVQLLQQLDGARGQASAGERANSNEEPLRVQVEVRRQRLPGRGLADPGQADPGGH